MFWMTKLSDRMVIFIFWIMVLLAIGSIVYLLAHNLSEDYSIKFNNNCQEAGGSYTESPIGCYKTINGEYVEGRPVEINEEWVFVRT